MKYFYNTLFDGNPLLGYAGLVNLLLGFVCLVLMAADQRQLLGVSVWLKPLKFFLSITIFMWTMALYLSWLPRPTAVRAYSVMMVIVFAIEMIIIAWQAARGQLSHFNISTPINGILFQVMGIAIVTLTVWTLVMAVYFFQQAAPEHLPTGFWWGIRLGMVLFVIFALEGGMMAARLQHTVGAADGGTGLPVLNWSRSHGDLRVSHFIGMHALQVLPLLGYFVLRRPAEIMLAAACYGALAAYVLLRALGGKPLFW